MSRGVWFEYVNNGVAMFVNMLGSEMNVAFVYAFSDAEKQQEYLEFLNGFIAPVVAEAITMVHLKGLK